MHRHRSCRTFNKCVASQSFRVLFEVAAARACNWGVREHNEYSHSSHSHWSIPIPIPVYSYFIPIRIWILLLPPIPSRTTPEKPRRHQKPFSAMSMQCTSYYNMLSIQTFKFCNCCNVDILPIVFFVNFTSSVFLLVLDVSKYHKVHKLLLAVFLVSRSSTCNLHFTREHFPRILHFTTALTKKLHMMYDNKCYFSIPQMVADHFCRLPATAFLTLKKYHRHVY